MDGALGFGMPDSGAIAGEWQGFWHQIRGAAIAAGTYQKVWAQNNVGKPISLYDGVATPQNAGTALVYRYTPHASAAVTTHKLYKRYFPDLLV